MPGTVKSGLLPDADRFYSIISRTFLGRLFISGFSPIAKEFINAADGKGYMPWSSKLLKKRAG